MPGVYKPLIDDEGFPLPDLDLFAIREARQQLIRTQNDHKNLMNKIEEEMSSYFKIQKENNQILLNNIDKKEYKKNEDDYDKNLVQVFDDDDINNEKNRNFNKIKLPFATITAILGNSPAEESGLKEGDGIFDFGGIISTMSNPLEKIANLVRSNENKEIVILVIRKNQINSIEIKLIPHKWEGNGLLGCKLSIN